MALAETGGTLKEDWNIDNLRAMRLPLEHAVATGKRRKEHLLFFDCEAYGYPCPICEDMPEKFVKPVTFGGKVLGEHVYYKLSCNCEKDMNDNVLTDRSIIDRLKAADIPEEYKNIDWNSWDYSVNKGLCYSFNQTKTYSTGTGIRELIGKGMLFYGHVGRGKTHSGICLMKSIIKKTKLKCKYIPMSDFTEKIISSGENGKYLETIRKFDVLFLDDLDKLSMASEWVQERVFSIFDYMFRNNKTLMLSTNLESIPAMEQYFGRNGEAIMSRVAAKVIFARFMGGDDHRKTRRKNQMTKKVT